MSNNGAYSIVSDLRESGYYKNLAYSGSSKLIGIAKEYLCEQIELLAKEKGANAVIGVDVETTFGTGATNVAITGTAVLISPSGTSPAMEKNDNSTSIVSITQSNSPTEFVPVEISVSDQYGACSIVLILQSLNVSAPIDIIADVEFKSIFGDKQLVENVCFLNIQRHASMYESSPVRVKLYEHISPCMDTCSIRIRKYRLNNQLIEIANAEMHDTERIQEIQSNSIENCEVDSYGWLLDENPGFVRCPNCGKRVSGDYMKYRDACIACGFQHAKQENLSSSPTTRRRSEKR